MTGLEEPDASSVELGSDLRESRVIKESGRTCSEEGTPKLRGI
jgi:hypothetical protein